MGYLEQHLMPGEKIAYRTTLHWIIFLLPALLFLAALGFLIAAAVGRAGPWGYLGGISGLVCVLATVWRYITYATSEFGVTDKRVIAKVGWIGTHSIEILLTKVEAVRVDQGIWGRILGYGTVVVTGSGGTQEPFAVIASPFEFSKRVQEQGAALR